MSTTTAPLLEAVGVSKRYGGVVAIESVDIDLHSDEVLALIGPNGSGKTTFVNVLSGVVPPSGGTLRIDGQPAHFEPAARMCRQHHLARTFQNVRLCRTLTALDNVLVGMHQRFSPRSLVRFGRPRGVEAEAVGDALELLDFVGIGRLADIVAGNLSYSDQRRVEIARALATRPRAVMLDEPAAGMNPNEAAALAGLVRDIARRGVAVMLIEHNMTVVMGVADRVVVLDAGRCIAAGSPSEVAADPLVQAAYLGKRGSDE